MVKYSIVIPTYNRVETLAVTLHSALSQPGSDFEVVVQDNASSDGTRDYLTSLSDPRLRCFFGDQHVGMADNWTLAIEKARGQFLFVLGDDDAIMPNALTEMDGYLEEFPDAEVVAWRRYDYGWPTAAPLMQNRLFVNYEMSYGMLDSRDRLHKVLNLELNHEFLPKIYSAFVSAKLIDRVIATCGKYFVERSTPDVSSGVVNLCFSDKVVFTHKALSIAGTSGKSCGASFLFSAHGNADTIRDTKERVKNTAIHHLLDVGVRQEVLINDQAILNSCLLSLEECGVAVEIDVAKLVSKIINGVFADRIFDSGLNREYLEKLAAKHQLGIVWPEEVIYNSEFKRDVKFGPVFIEDRLVGVNINTAKVGIMDIYRASHLAEMLTRGKPQVAAA